MMVLVIMDFEEARRYFRRKLLLVHGSRNGLVSIICKDIHILLILVEIREDNATFNADLQHLTLRRKLSINKRVDKSKSCCLSEQGFRTLPITERAQKTHFRIRLLNGKRIHKL